MLCYALFVMISGSDNNHFPGLVFRLDFTNWWLSTVATVTRAYVYNWTYCYWFTAKWPLFS